MLRFYTLHRLPIRLASTGCGRSGGTLCAGAMGLGQPWLPAAGPALYVQGVCAGTGAWGRSAAPPQRNCQRLSPDRAAARTGAPDARACGAGAERRPGAPGPAHHPDAAHRPSPGRPAAAPRAPLGRYRLRGRGGALLGAQPLAGQGRVLLAPPASQEPGAGWYPVLWLGCPTLFRQHQVERSSLLQSGSVPACLPQAVGLETLWAPFRFHIRCLGRRRASRWAGAPARRSRSRGPVSTPRSSRPLPGPQARFTVGQAGSGMSGRALKVPGRLGRVMFAASERDFLAADAVRCDASVVDPAGAAPRRSSSRASCTHARRSSLTHCKRLR